MAEVRALREEPTHLMPATFELAGDYDEVVGRASGGEVWHKVDENGEPECVYGHGVEHYRPKSWAKSYDTHRTACKSCFSNMEQLGWVQGMWADRPPERSVRR